MFSTLRKRLRHPIRQRNEPFGKAGLTVAILALVFAMVGGAWAAGGLNPKQKKEVTKIAKKYAGKPGVPGANGTNGTNGTAGAKGDKGEKGDTGNNGTSVTGTPILTSSATCNHQGGTAYTSASGTENVCNGKEGEPWTPNNTLPNEATETGAWTFSDHFSTESVLLIPISFPIQLGEELGASHVHFLGPEAAHTTANGNLTEGSNLVENITGVTGKFAVGETISGTKIPAGTTIVKVISTTELELSANVETGGTATVSLTADLPADCTGGSATEPKAAPGSLCVYSAKPGAGGFLGNESLRAPEINNAGKESGNLGAGRAGALMAWAGSTQGFIGWGQWAVTAK